MTSKQLLFSGMAAKKAHGGDLARGKRKSRRPFDPKQALHVVLRSERARGELSLLHPKNCNHVKALLDRLKNRWDVRVYRYANVGNHVHLLVKCRSRAAWQGFIREFSGGVAMIVTGARKGSPRIRKDDTQRAFWDGLVFTRIVSFGQDFKNVANYVAVNLWEGAGVPIRKLLNRGLRVLEISDGGGILIANRMRI